MNNLILLKASILTIAAFFTAFKSSNESATSSDSEKKAGFSINSIDIAVNPKSDFYHFVNGNWLKSNPVPQTESSWGSFIQSRRDNEKLLRKILETATADTKALKGSINQQIGDFYYTATDTLKLEKEGIKPVAGEIQKINATNPHSPGMYRVLGPLSNMPEFYAAFDVKPGDAMFRKEEDRAKYGNSKIYEG